MNHWDTTLETRQCTGVAAPVCIATAYPEVTTAVVELSDGRTDPWATQPVHDGAPGVGWKHDLLAAPARTLKTGPLIAAGATDEHNIVRCKLVRARVCILERHAERRLPDEAEPN